jgi:two-component system KDP operon response regulator KdpE
MPGKDGFETCRQLRRLRPRIAILMLTVRNGEEDKVAALESGADDYVIEPFQIRELTARIRASIRQTQVITQENIAIRIGEIELDPARREVRKFDNFIHLTPKEFNLLHYLMSHAGLPIRHGRLLNAVWGSDYGDEMEYHRSFVSQLPKKIEDEPGGQVSADRCPDRLSFPGS